MQRSRIEDYASRVIRDDRYKVWVDSTGEINELYDIQKDPLEQNNLLERVPDAAKSSLAKLQKVVDSMPKKDGRPQYRDRAENSWDQKYDPNKKYGSKKK